MGLWVCRFQLKGPIAGGLVRDERSKGREGGVRPGKGTTGSGSAEVAVRTGTCPLGASGASGESGSDPSGCWLQRSFREQGGSKRTVLELGHRPGTAMGVG